MTTGSSKKVIGFENCSAMTKRPKPDHPVGDHIVDTAALQGAIHVPWPDQDNRLVGR
jgi:hypothetical protein